MFQLRYKSKYNFQLTYILIILVLIYVLYTLFNLNTFEHLIDVGSVTQKPNLKDGDKFYLKTIDGKYVSVCHNCRPNDANINNLCSAVLCLKDEPFLSSIFTYRSHRDYRFSVQTMSGAYWKRCRQCLQFCPDTICADGLNKNLRTHKFILIKNRNKSISIKTDTGRLLEVSDCNQNCGKIIASIGSGRDQEFIIQKITNLNI